MHGRSPQSPRRILDIINLPGIVGVLLAGLAGNVAVKEHPAKAKLEFFGKALCIPSFFIVAGLLIDPVTFARSIIDKFLLHRFHGRRRQV